MSVNQEKLITNVIVRGFEAVIIGTIILAVLS